MKPRISSLILKKSLKLFLVVLPFLPIVGGCALYGFLNEIGGSRLFKYVYTEYHLMALVFVAVGGTILTIYYCLILYPLLLWCGFVKFSKMVFLDKYRGYAVYVIVAASVVFNSVAIVGYKIFVYDREMGYQYCVGFFVLFNILWAIQLILIGVVVKKDVALGRDGFSWLFKKTARFVWDSMVKGRQKKFWRWLPFLLSVANIVSLATSGLIFMAFEELFGAEYYIAFLASSGISLMLYLAYTQILLKHFEADDQVKGLVNLLLFTIVAVVIVAAPVGVNVLAHSMNSVGLADNPEDSSWFYLTNEAVERSKILKSWPEDDVERMKSGVQLMGYAAFSSQNYTLFCSRQRVQRGDSKAKNCNCFDFKNDEIRRYK